MRIFGLLGLVAALVIVGLLAFRLARLFGVAIEDLFLYSGEEEES